MKYLLVALMLLTNISLANEISYPAIVATQVDRSTVIFDQCFEQNTCRTIGNASGYQIDDLTFKPGLKKLTAVSIGVAEIAVGWVAGYLSGWASTAFGASDDVMWTVFAGAWAGTTAAPTIAKSELLSPILRWKMSNMEKKIQKKNFDSNNQIVIEADDDIELVKMVRILKRVLNSIEK